MQQSIQVHTQHKRQVVDITQQVSSAVSEQALLVALYVQHTTCGLSLADLDAGGTDLDYLEAFEKLVPPLRFRHPHDPSHMPDHILSSLIGPEAIVPCRDGQLLLGTWQRIVLFEFDGPRDRSLVITSLPE